MRIFQEVEKYRLKRDVPEIENFRLDNLVQGDFQVNMFFFCRSTTILNRELKTYLTPCSGISLAHKWRILRRRYKRMVLADQKPTYKKCNKKI